MVTETELARWAASYGASGDDPIDETDFESPDVWFRTKDGKVIRVAWSTLNMLLDRVHAGLCMICGTKNCWPERHERFGPAYPVPALSKDQRRVGCSQCGTIVFRSNTTGVPPICFDCAQKCGDCGAVMTSMLDGGWKCFQCLP